MFCDSCGVAVVLVSAFFSLADGRPGIFDSSHGLSAGSYSGGGGNGYGSASYASPGEGLGSYGSDQNGLESSSHDGGSDGGGDYHHGVSVVSLGSQKGPTFDLTKHSGGDDHHGLYGGSFVAGKYEASDDGGHQGGHGQGNHYTSVVGYGDHDDHSALISASLSDEPAYH